MTSGLKSGTLRAVAESMCAGGVFEEGENRKRNFVDTAGACSAAFHFSPVVLDAGGGGRRRITMVKDE